jgi:hypothetical protein
MAHSIELFVGPPRALARGRWALGVGAVVALEQGLAALPVADEVYDALRAHVGRGALRERPRKRAHFEGDWRREGPLLDAFGAWLGRERAVAYVETAYFGGAGDHGACAWRGGRRAYGPRRGEGAVNGALALAGVAAGAGGDEFAAVGLGARRSLGDFVGRPAGPLAGGAGGGRRAR